MLHKLKNRKAEGFTIIEVLIVLAIAGLILLIVFLAVPALQRNSRNTQRKNDVQAVLGAVSEFQSNNAGAIPSDACGSANPYTLVSGSCGSPTGTSAAFKLGYYTAVPSVGTGAHVAVTTDTLTIQTGAACSGAAAVAGSARQVAALYEVEGGGGLTGTCTDS